MHRFPFTREMKMMHETPPTFATREKEVFYPTRE